MTTDLKIEPIVKQLTVPRDARAAFDYFTADIDKWWPKRSHSLGGDETKSITMETKVGGRLFETNQDGTETIWGKVVEFEPGKVLNFTWHIGRPEEQSTNVKVTFDDAADGTSTVTLTHYNWDALGDEGPKAREGYNNGWVIVFGERFATYAKSGKAFDD